MDKVVATAREAVADISGDDDGVQVRLTVRLG